MVNITRIAKSASNWTHKDTEAYNLPFVPGRSASTFFEVTQLPAPPVSNEILTCTNADEATSDDNYHLLSCRHCRTSQLRRRPPSPTSSWLFSRRWDRLDRTPAARATSLDDRSRGTGGSRDTNVVLLVQEGRRMGGPGPDPAYPQFIAQAIAAYQSLTIPGVVFVGTAPTFYKIPVTEELAPCVEREESPPL
ncbi:hypothetical protein MSAN_00068000 [Mycena sanguinolenta]|uniref:Uncharacterized protein n=1 Tax=Mycena sanguinolenta TaxID=230812 RepID=A0A8H6ZJ69_9AGAR|nr:hypothetical protein MSAN_00068000 [Mycena sanguinolenta]